MRRDLLLGLVLVGCGPQLEWRPKTAREYEARPVPASRVEHVGPECTDLGVIHAEGEGRTVISGIAEEAAKRGGTHYVVRGDESDSEVVTRGAFTSTGGVTRSHVEDGIRHTWAVVYRCVP